MGGNDFVNVRLTDFGVNLASGGAVKVIEGNHNFECTEGETLRVTRAFDWERVLSRQHVNGHPLFEIAPEGAELRGDPQPGPKSTEVESNESV